MQSWKYNYLTPFYALFHYNHILFIINNYAIYAPYRWIELKEYIILDMKRILFLTYYHGH